MRDRFILKRVGGYDPEAPATHHDPTLEREKEGHMRFAVYGRLAVGVLKVVEANSEEEARELAESLGTPALCWQCSGAGGKGAWQLSDGLEGEAEIVEVERV